jgi:competence protein ComEC
VKKSRIALVLSLLIVLVIAAIVYIYITKTPPPPNQSPTPTITPIHTPITTPIVTTTPTPAQNSTPTTTEGTLPQLQVHYIDVGQGDSILLDLGATEVLIDGGDKSPGVVPYLQQHVDGPLEAMIATHPHADHIGGLIAVLDAFNVERIWTNGQTYSTQTYTDFMGKVNAEGADVQVARRGDTIGVGNLTFKVLNPVEPLSSDYNSGSIVLMLSYGNVDFLFMGDAQQDSESSMIAAGEIHHIDILKVGHHGSRTSSSQEFLNIVKPEVAIYMAGVGNIYGHPHPETISALQAIGAQIYGTDTCGTITVTTDGNSYTVSTAKKCATTTTTLTPRPLATSPPTTTVPTSTSLCIGATAICNDGTCSYSQHRSGTCSHHGGVGEWVNPPPN